MTRHHTASDQPIYTACEDIRESIHLLLPDHRLKRMAARRYPGGQLFT
jgi:hypothetical protein